MLENNQSGSILVPVDFSPHSEAALLKACEFASCMNHSLIVLHVVHDPGDMPGYYSKYYFDSIDKKPLVTLEYMAEKMFEEFINSLIKKYPQNTQLKKIKTMLVTGLPVTRIIEVVEQENISMVVMGSQGRTGLQHFLLGSKAEQMVRLCPVPVTIVKINNS